MPFDELEIDVNSQGLSGKDYIEELLFLLLEIYLKKRS